MNTVGIISGLMGLDDQSSNYYGVWFYVQSDNTLQISYGDGGSKDPSHRRTKVGTTALAADRWYHITAVLRGPTDMDLYIDAIADAGTYSGTGGSLKYSNGTSSTAQYLNGVMDDVRIYNRALSAEDVWQLYQQGLQ